MNYIDKLKQLSLPNEKQIENFIEFLLGHHSWFKHLDLIKGGSFTIYLDNNLKYGNLCYLWHDDYTDIKIPEPYKNSWIIKLYPYCHYEFDQGHSIHKNNIHKSDNKEKLTEWLELFEKRETLWQSLTEKENNIISENEEEDLINFKSSGIQKYLKIDNKIYKIEESLRNKEKEKVRTLIKTILKDVKELTSNKT